MNYTLETAIVALGAFLALLGAAFAHDSLFAAHMWVLFFTLLVSTVLLLRRVSFAPVDSVRRHDHLVFTADTGNHQCDEKGIGA